MAGPARDWRTRSACRDVDPETFFPVAESGPVHDAAVTAAKAVCARCPVRAECLADALDRLPYGVAGGLTEHERRRLRRRGRTSSTPPPAAAVDDVIARSSSTPAERSAAGRSLLTAGCTVRETARRAGVTERTAERWAAANRTATRSA